MSFWSSATAAWVQAIGSIIAIGAAIWIGRHETREAQRREKTKMDALARAFAYRYMPIIIAVRREIEEARNFALAQSSGFAMTENLETVQTSLRISNFRLGPEEPGWALEPNTAKVVYQLSNTVTGYNEFVDRFVPRLRMMNGFQRADYTNRMADLHIAVQRIAEAAKRELGAIHDADS